ncbi:hypothetical protein DFH07DRAFT_959987 [Mycena maculata]|uniref:F-box domain-containing protein n=1 Tax=Mycena maculata TaxID=230809 RepID=A0AAD7J100_9AGAR|nr:hypothetical protein DFH07DRAFT_959987 [Mycena maculata]
METRKTRSQTRHSRSLSRNISTVNSPLLLLPPELLTHVALHLATRPPNLGPPSALLPLLLTCRFLNSSLSWKQNKGLWSQIGRAKFTTPPPPLFDFFVASDGDAQKRTFEKWEMGGSVASLRSHITIIRIIRSGDIYHPAARAALRGAWAMLVADGCVDDVGPGGEVVERMDSGGLPVALGLSPGTPSLASLTAPPTASAARTGSGAGDASRGVAPGKNRRQLAWAGARAFALRYVRERMYEGRFGEASGHPGRAHPAWRSGWPLDTDAGAAALWIIWFFEDGETLRAEPDPVRRHLLILLLPFVVAPFRYASTLCPAHHYSVPLLPDVLGMSGGGRAAGAITVPTNHGPFPIYTLGAPAASPGAGSTVAVAGGRGAPVRGRGGGGIGGGRGSARAPPSRLLTAPPARLLFFARMQVGGRMGVPPHLARDRAELLASGAPMAIGPTQADILEKNSRPVVRFERQVGVGAGEEGVVVRDDGGDGDDDIERRGDGGAGAGGRGRWVADAWRARLCRGYGGRELWDSVPSGSGDPVVSAAMPSEAPYNALVALPGGTFPPGGLVRDDFVTAARPVYMRIAEHHSFHPHPPLPPPLADSTTGEEGMCTGWLPHDARVVSVGDGRIEMRVDASSSSWHSGVAGRRDEAYVYETIVEGRVRDGAHDMETCPGCERVRERARAQRAMWAAEEEGDDTSSQGRPPSSPGSQTESLLSQSSGPEGSSSPHDSSADADWPEWNAPAWAERFDEGWESACDGVQDVVFTGATDPHHGMAWHHYEYAGRVRPWDGLIGLVMRPRDRTIGLATYFISGHLVGRDTFEGTWQMASQDVLAPSWGGSVCFARGEE